MDIKEIFARQLTAARRMANMSMAKLAEAMGNQVQKQSIGKYEKGEMLPSSTTLITLAKALNVPVDFFFKTSIVNLDLSNLAFRKKARLKSKEYQSIVEKTRDFIQRYLELEFLLNIPSAFKNPLVRYPIKSDDDIETAAQILRQHWNAGTLNPIHKVFELLEQNHVKIIELEVSPDFDGLSTMIQDIPIIVVNKKNDNVRKRFTALHELAHLVLNFPAEIEEKAREKLCHHFAGAFLIPREAFLQNFPGYSHRTMFSKFELIKMKESYGLSIQAIMARAKNLEIINQHQYEDFCKKIKMSGEWKNEPGKYPVEEVPARFDILIHQALADEVIGFSKASTLSGKSIDMLYKEFDI